MITFLKYLGLVIGVLIVGTVLNLACMLMVHFIRMLDKSIGAPVTFFTLLGLIMLGLAYVAYRADIFEWRKK